MVHNRSLWSPPRLLGVRKMRLCDTQVCRAPKPMHFLLPGMACPENRRFRPLWWESPTHPYFRTIHSELNPVLCSEKHSGDRYGPALRELVVQWWRQTANACCKKGSWEPAGSTLGVLARPQWGPGWLTLRPERMNWISTEFILLS